MGFLEFLAQHPTEVVFIATLVIYTALLAVVTYWYSKSGDQVAHENFPKAIKHINEAFVSIIIFLLLFYLAWVGILPEDVLITLVSVFATAGFLSIKDKL